MNPQLRFPGWSGPSDDYQLTRDRRRAGPWYVDVPLDTARSIAAGTAQILRALVGNVLYLDQAQTTGNATLTLTDEQQVSPVKISVSGGFVFKGPFAGMVIENAAQPGKTLRIIWGTDIDFLPSVFYIGGVVSTQEVGYQYGAAYSSNANIAAGGTSQVFAPASNVNGAVLHHVSAYSLSAGAAQLTCLAKSGAAPASSIDGDIITRAIAAAAGTGAQSPTLEGPIRLAPGKGLWFWSSVLETGSLRSVLYTLL